MFNALKYIKQLEGVGVPREQAETHVQLVMDCFQDNVATKADLAELRSELKSDMAELRSELKTDIAELKSELKGDIADLRGEFAGLKGEFAVLKGEFADLKADVVSIKSELLLKLGGFMAVCTAILGFLIKF